MFFNYRKSPLGTSVREFMSCIVGWYRSVEEAEEEAEKLSGRLSGRLRVVDVENIDGYARVAMLDPDIVEVVRSSGSRYVLLVDWATLDVGG